MINVLLERLTGKDDLERVAWRNDLELLNRYLETRAVFVPRRPSRFVEPDATKEETLKTLEQDCQELANDPFEPWILEVDGKRRLPAFSSVKKAEPFVAAIAKRMNKIFGLQCGQVVLPKVIPDLNVDVVDLNPFSAKSWEIAVRGR